MTMIYVSDKQYTQVKYLIGQSIQGNHVLFDLDLVRNAFRQPQIPLSAEINAEQAYSVEHHIEALIELPNLQKIRAYLESLDPNTLDTVIRTYFYIVENNLIETSSGILH